VTAAYLERDGVAIHYEVHGAASRRTPLLLTHGYSASSAMWKPNLAVLAERRQIVTWDMRGHGRSGSPRDPSRYSEEASVADMAAILGACGIGRAAVGGLSLGGYLSLAFHLACPARVAGLLLCDTGPGFKRVEGRDRWNAYAEGRAGAFEQQGLAALSTSPEIGAGPHDPIGLALAARGMLTQHDSRIIESLTSIRVPTLIVVGEHDEPFLAAGAYLEAKIPGAARAVIRNAGHASNIDQPAAFNRIATAFLERLD
jgi:pimeloyl-ACP methyl ester carboxylesterase